MSIDLFDIDTFRTLSDRTLDEYASRMLTLSCESFSIDDYDELISMLPNANEFHSVYIIELCAKLDPNRFAPIAVTYLRSRIASLCCAASRVLGSIQSDALSVEVRTLIEECPIVELYWDDPATGVSRQVGTNEIFLSELREKFGIGSKTAGQ